MSSPIDPGLVKDENSWDAFGSDHTGNDEPFAKPEPENLVEDDDYYFQDIIFLVENCLFKLPRHEFVSNSSFFRDLFSLPTTNSVEPDGSSNRSPLRLENIKKADFKTFLRILYPRAAFNPGAHVFTLLEWIAILKLATMWDFEAIRTLAIGGLTPLLENDPVEKVVLSRTYNVESWLLPALNKLAQRAEPIKPDEAEKLGIVTALNIAAVRECCSTTTTTSYTTNHYGSQINAGTNTVESLLGVRGAKVSVDFTAKIKAMFAL